VNFDPVTPKMTSVICVPHVLAKLAVLTFICRTGIPK